MYEHYNVKLQAKTFSLTLAEGARGNQPHILSELLIVDGADLADTNFACGLDWTRKTSIPMSYKWIPSKKLFKIAPDTDKPLKVSDVAYVSFGNTAKGDINLCDPLATQWKIKNG